MTLPQPALQINGGSAPLPTSLYNGMRRVAADGRQEWLTHVTPDNVG